MTIGSFHGVVVQSIILYIVHSRPLFRLLSVFVKQTLQFLLQYNVKIIHLVSTAWIWTHDLLNATLLQSPQDQGSSPQSIILHSKKTFYKMTSWLLPKREKGERLQQQLQTRTNERTNERLIHSFRSSYSFLIFFGFVFISATTPLLGR